MSMRSNRPYILRAFFDWIVDNDCTPYVVIDAHYPGVEVPQDYVTDGQIVLNIAPRAVTNFILDLEILAFSTRFGGVPIEIKVPVFAVVGIYSHENGQGTVFEPVEPDLAAAPPPVSGPKVVRTKSPVDPKEKGAGNKVSGDKGPDDKGPNDSGPNTTGPKNKDPKKSKPSLRVIK